MKMMLTVAVVLIGAAAMAAPERRTNPTGTNERQVRPLQTATAQRCADALTALDAATVDLDDAWVRATNSLALWQALPASATRTAGIELARGAKSGIKAQRDMRAALRAAVKAIKDQTERQAQ